MSRRGAPLTDTRTIASALDQAAGRLAVLHDSAKVDAEALLCHVLGKPRSHLYAWPERVLAPGQWQAFQRLVARREQGEPVAYLTGRREFWSLPLAVSEHTLIPRPETELLVELALAHIPESVHWVIADLGTGSGAVGLAIARQRSACHVLATECSPGALKVARENRRRLGAPNISLVQADWCRPLAPGSCHLIVANPPYVPSGDPHLSRGDVRYEPRSALVGGEDGLDAIRAIGREARGSLHSAGMLLLEHGHDQAARVRALLEGLGYRDVRSYRDLADMERVTLGSVP